MKGSFVALNVMKDPFIVPGVMKDPFVVLTVMKGPFMTSGHVPPRISDVEATRPPATAACSSCPPG
ncbi:hypothetical protein H4W32_004803 [Actinophytocola algeriensis]|uniref:Uncharacterized protein n=1 Tax=Actinophytocola algeriensis TaxID=1768010 RepID=A0A7W7VBV4_9PSEU|nr:hypothetical protein [Actinophytocola algeriensis]MBE1476761.1 hypothetical protein [Actinophytocola algeriensis]